MKIIRYAIIFAFSFLLFQNEIKAQWNPLPLNCGFDLAHMSFPSDDTGYFYSYKIYRTLDAGYTFDSLLVPGFTQYNSIYFRTGVDGVVTGVSSAIGNAVFRSVNEGFTWNNITPSNIIGSPMNAKFADFFNGTVLTSSNIFYHTANGGLSWDTASFGYDYFYALDFPTTTVGYMGGFDGTFAYRGVILKTIDGGATWDSICNLTQWNSTIHDIHFVDADTGFAAFNPYAQLSRLMRTHDGGVTWDTVLFPNGQIVQFAFSNAHDGFIVNDSGSIYRTNDAGISWQMDRPHTVYLNDICVTPSFAYAIGNSGVIIKRDLISAIPEQAQQAQANIFPNPGNDQATLQLNRDFEIASVQAFDVSGRNCGQIPFTTSSTGEIHLDTRNLVAGWYQLEVKGKQGIVTVKFGKVGE